MMEVDNDVEDILKILEEHNKGLSELSEKVKNILEAIKEHIILLESVKDVGMEKKERCRYYEEGFCKRCYWENEPKGVPFVLKFKSVEEKWYMDPHPFYCALCWDYGEII